MNDSETFLVCGITSSQLPDEFRLQLSRVSHLVSLYVELMIKQWVLGGVVGVLRWLVWPLWGLHMHGEYNTPKDGNNVW